MKRLIVSCILLLLLCCAVSAALANSWGLSGPLLTYVSAVHTWNDYSADTFFYKRNADTTAAVISSRYHSILMVSGPLDSGITHSSTTAVFQPADKSGHPTVTCTDQTVTVFYSKPACSFTFTREPGPRQDYYLTHAEKGGIVFDMSLEDNVCLVNQRLVWQTEPITLENFNIRYYGPLFEYNPIFPERINTEFITVTDRKNISMRVWERGSGETWACGTGACAAAVAGVLNGWTDRNVTVHLRGGNLAIEWDEERNTVFMTGSATKVFDGEIDL